MQHRNLTSFALGGVIVIVLGASGVVTARSFQQPVSSVPAPAPVEAKESRVESNAGPLSEARHFGETKPDRHNRQVGLSDSFAVDLVADQPQQLGQTPDIAAADDADVADSIEAADAPKAVAAGGPLSIQPLHRVQLADDGLLPGRLSLIDSAAGDRVALQQMVVHFVRNGRIVSVAEPGVGGVFQASGLTPGIYSVIAASPNGLLATAVEIVPPLRRDEVFDAQAVEGKGSPKLATALEIRGNPIPAQHLRYALELLRSKLSAAEERPQPYTEQVRASRVLGGNEEPNGTGRVPVVQTGATDAMQAVFLRKNGQIAGTVRRLDAASDQPIQLADTEVHVVQDSGMTVRAQTDKDGRFRLQGVRPGVASFVAVGPAGFAAFSFEVRLPEDPSAQKLNQPHDEPLHHVAFVQHEEMSVEAASQVDAALVDPANFAVAQDIIDESSPDGALFGPPPPEPFPTGAIGGGGFGGGAGGGGAGGGGLFGGNLGGLLLGAGVGAGVGAAVSSNRSRSERVVVVSPAAVD